MPPITSLMPPGHPSCPQDIPHAPSTSLIPHPSCPNTSQVHPCASLTYLFSFKPRHLYEPHCIPHTNHSQSEHHSRAPAHPSGVDVRHPWHPGCSQSATPTSPMKRTKGNHHLPTVSPDRSMTQCVKLGHW